MELERRLRGVHSGSGQRTKLILFAIVAILVAFISLFFTVGNRPSSASIAPFAALGEVTAEETAKLLDNKGSIVIVTRDTSQQADPELEAQLKAFQRTVRQRGLTLAATEAARVEADFTDDGLLRSDFFLNLLPKYPDATAIVSFVGPPSLNAQQIRALPQKIPKIIAVSLTGTPRRLLQSNVIQVAIVARTGAAPQLGKKPASTRETFDQYFQVVTAGNTGS